MQKNVLVDIKLDIDGNRLKAVVNIDSKLKGDLYYTYLLKDEVVYRRSESWGTDTNFEWDLSESGNYAVQFHLKRGENNIIHFSNSITFLDTKDLNEFNSYLKNGPDTKVADTSEFIFTPKYPYTDFILISQSKSRSIKGKIEEFSKNNGFETCSESKNRKNILISNQDSTKNKEKMIIYFQGHVF